MLINLEMYLKYQNIMEAIENPILKNLNNLF